MPASESAACTCSALSSTSDARDDGAEPPAGEPCELQHHREAATLIDARRRSWKRVWPPDRPKLCHPGTSTSSVRVADEFVVALETASGPSGTIRWRAPTSQVRASAYPGYDSYRVAGTSSLVFYSAAPGQLEIIRVLHERRDIDADLLES